MSLKKYYILVLLFFGLIVVFCSKEKTDESSSANNINKFRYVVPKSGLRLRKEPNLNALRLALIPCGSKVIFIEDKNDEKVIDGVKGKWTKIKYNDISGWVFGGFLSEQK